MTTLDTTITIVQLIATLLPSIGVLGFLLANRHQHIRAELDKLHMQQQHEQMLRLQNTKQTEAVTAALQAYAPAFAVVAERALAKPSKRMTAADLSDEQLVAEFRRRAGEDFFDPDCDECVSERGEDPTPNPIN